MVIYCPLQKFIVAAEHPAGNIALFVLYKLIGNTFNHGVIYPNYGENGNEKLQFSMVQNDKDLNCICRNDFQFQKVFSLKEFNIVKKFHHWFCVSQYWESCNTRLL